MMKLGNEKKVGGENGKRKNIMEAAVVRSKDSVTKTKPWRENQ